MQVIKKARKDHICDHCGRKIEKGQRYFYDRNFFCHKEDGETFLWGEDVRKCFRCDYKQKQHEKRFERFKPTCEHKFCHDEYSYIPGECVMQPECTVCNICGERF